MFNVLDMSLTMPPPTRNLRPVKSSTLVMGRFTLNTMPGPCENKEITFTPWCSAANSGYLELTRLKATEMDSALLPKKGNSVI